MMDLWLIVGQKMFWNAMGSKNMVKITSNLHLISVVKANKNAYFESACAEWIISNWIRFLFQSVHFLTEQQ